MTTNMMDTSFTAVTEKKLSFLDLDTLKMCDRMLTEGKEKLKKKILIALEQDIEKIRIARNLDLFIKLKFLKFLTATLVYYGSEENVSLIEKTLGLFNELKRRNVMNVEDRIFHEFVGTCSRELFSFCINELQSQQSLMTIFLEEYAHQYISSDSKNVALFHGFQLQTLGFEFFIHFCQENEKQGKTLDINITKYLNINDNKTYSNLLAKHLKEFPKLNLYGQIRLFEKIRDSRIIKDIGGHLERYTKQNINMSGVVALFYEYQLVFALKREEYPTWKKYLEALVITLLYGLFKLKQVEKLAAQLNSSWSSLLEKQAFLILLLLTFETYQHDSNFKATTINLLPFENAVFKLQKIFVCYLNENVFQATPETLELFINHFQTFRRFSSDSPIFEVIWKLFKFLVFRFPIKGHVDKAFNAVIGFVEEKPALNQHLVHILRQLAKSPPHQDIYYHLCKKVQIFLLKKHPGDLMHYFPLIEFFIEENFDKSILEIIHIFKKVLLSEEFNHEHSFIIASNTLHCIKKIIALYSQLPEFPLADLKQILEEFQELDDSYLREECLTLLKFLKILPKDRFLEFIEPAEMDIEKCFMLLSREGHGEFVFNKEQFDLNFDFKVSKKERIDRGILDGASAFAVKNITNELNIVLIEEEHNNTNSFENDKAASDLDLIAESCLLDKDDIVIMFSKSTVNKEGKKDLFCFAVDLSKKICSNKEENIIPPEIFNLEFTFPGLDWLYCTNSVCIPFLSSETEENKKRITFVTQFESCHQGKLDLGVSFTDMTGNVFCGTIPLINLDFKDFFVKMEYPDLHFTEEFLNDLKSIQEQESIKMSDIDSLQLLYYYYLQETHCKVDSVRIIRQPADKVIQKCKEFLQVYKVHNEYFINESDQLAMKYYNLLYPDQRNPEVEDSVIVPQKQNISRILIGLPGKNYMCLLFCIQDKMTTVRITTSADEILQFLDEYFDEWEQEAEV